jgi:hypothetical protein
MASCWVERSACGEAGQAQGEDKLRQTAWTAKLATASANADCCWATWMLSARAGVQTWGHGGDVAELHQGTIAAAMTLPRVRPRIVKAASLLSPAEPASETQRLIYLLVQHPIVSSYTLSYNIIHITHSSQHQHQHQHHTRARAACIPAHPAPGSSRLAAASMPGLFGCSA